MKNVKSSPALVAAVMVLAALAARDDVTVEIARLEVGDYRVERRVVVERKTVADFAASLIDGRLFQQAAALALAPERSVLVLEGRDQVWRDTGVRREALQGALITIGGRSSAMPPAWSTTDASSGNARWMTPTNSLTKPTSCSACATLPHWPGHWTPPTAPTPLTIVWPFETARVRASPAPRSMYREPRVTMNDGTPPYATMKP